MAITKMKITHSFISAIVSAFFFPKRILSTKTLLLPQIYAREREREREREKKREDESDEVGRY